MEVRQVEPEEYHEAAEVTVAGYRALPGAHLSPEYEVELRDVRARATGAAVFVAVEDGRVLGTATYVPGPDSPYAEDLRVGEAGLRMLSVDPTAQQRGVGAALVAACVARARADGASRLFLHSTPWMTAAHRLYLRLGFRRLPERDWTPVPEVPLLAFGLDLTGTVDMRPGGGTRKTRGA